MLLKTKFKISIIALFTILIASEMVDMRFIVYDSFAKLEQDEAIDNIDRVDQAIERETSQLDMICLNWASWQEMYNFVENRSQDFISSYLIFSSFKANNINLMAVVDSSMKVIWNKAYDLNSGEAINFKNFTNEQVLTDKTMISSDLLLLAGEPKENKGVIMTEHGPMLISIRPIKTINETSTPNGALIIASFFGKKTIEDLADLTKIRFSIDYPVRKLIYEKKEAVHSNVNDKSQTYYIEKNASWLNIKKLYMGLDRNPAFLIDVKLSRDITQKGKEVIIYSATYMIVSGLIIFFVSGFILKKRVFSRLDKMVRHMKAIEVVGDYSLRLNVKRMDEMGILASVFDNMIDKIESQTIELLKANGILKDLSSIDELTQIANRRIFNQHFEYEWKRMKRDKKPISVILCDIDFFKQYNDHYGHQKGDECLKNVADVLRSTVKRSCDLAARYGGEEFVVVLSNTDSSGAAHVAKNMIAQLKEQLIPHEASRVSSLVSMSLGIATVIPTDDYSCEDILKMADEALYIAKANGRNRFEISSV